MVLLSAMKMIQDPARKSPHAAQLSAVLLVGLSFVASAQPRSAPSGPPLEDARLADRQAAPVFVGSSTVALTNSMAVLNDTMKLGNGDRVSFRIVEDRSQPILLYVTDSGEMDVPYIGRVTGAGKTCRQIAYEIKPRLEKEYFVRATVIIALDTLSPKPRGKVTITGLVRSQILLDIMPDEHLTLSKAIIRAGGIADFGNVRKVKLTRKRANDPSGRTQTTIHDLREIIEKGHLEKDPELKADDLIYVPERLINI